MIDMGDNTEIPNMLHQGFIVFLPLFLKKNAGECPTPVGNYTLVLRGMGRCSSGSAHRMPDSLEYRNGTYFVEPAHPMFIKRGSVRLRSNAAHFDLIPLASFSKLKKGESDSPVRGCGGRSPKGFHPSPSRTRRSGAGTAQRSGVRAITSQFGEGADESFKWVSPSTFPLGVRRQNR